MTEWRSFMIKAMNLQFV